MIKKIMKVLSSTMLAFMLCLCSVCLVSCGKAPTTNDENVDFGTSVAVVYFSATGSTERVAGYIKDNLSANLIQITPTSPYTSADLNWNNSNSRVSLEHINRNNSSSSYYRPAISNSNIDFSKYDTIFIGYPIWWGEAPNVVYTFVEEFGNQFENKKIIPFCTSSSSSMGSSATNLKRISNAKGEWLNGQRFSSSASKSTVDSWLQTISAKN